MTTLKRVPAVKDVDGMPERKKEIFAVQLITINVLVLLERFFSKKNKPVV